MPGEAIADKKPFVSKEPNTLILKITSLFWLCAKLIGWRMYTTYRLFPIVPVLDFLDSVPPFVQTILFASSVFFIIAVFLKSSNKHLLIALLITDVLLCLFDQNRWQPWEYQYLFIIFLSIVNWRKTEVAFMAISILLAFTYIYSGLNKLNDGFLHEIWINTILGDFFKAPLWIINKHWIYLAGYILGMIELLSGVGLLFKLTQQKSAVILILVHLFILLLLGPFGLRYNKIVWPWNVAEILYLYVIFLGKNHKTIKAGLLNKGPNRLVILCWCILPALNFIGYWDNYLSMNLYSGKTPAMVICVSDTGNCKQLRRYFYKNINDKICTAETKISVQHWAVTETNVPVYPEPRVFKTIEAKLKKQYPLAGLVFEY